MKFLVSMCASLLIAVVILNFLPVNGEEEIYENTVRLHVLAASDSEEDQSLKLTVRDSVLEFVTERLQGVAECEDACAVIESMTDEIEVRAEDTLKAAGNPCPVEVTFDYEKYPIRYYDDFTLPSGVYKSLRVVIGEGDGQNWWCILFPSVCVPDAAEAEKDYIEAGFTPEQYKLIENGSGNKYRVRFKILEILSEFIGFNY